MLQLWECALAIKIQVKSQVFLKLFYILDMEMLPSLHLHLQTRITDIFEYLVVHSGLDVFNLTLTHKPFLSEFMQVEKEHDHALLLTLYPMGKDALLLQLPEDVLLEMFFEDGHNTLHHVLAYILSPSALRFDRCLLVHLLLCHMDALVQQTGVLLDEVYINSRQKKWFVFLKFDCHLKGNLFAAFRNSNPHSVLCLFIVLYALKPMNLYIHSKP